MIIKVASRRNWPAESVRAPLLSRSISPNQRGTTARPHTRRMDAGSGAFAGRAAVAAAGRPPGRKRDACRRARRGGFSVSSGPLSRLLDTLAGVRRTGSGYLARCPAHADQHNSLTVTENDCGDALLHCHAGCATEAVVQALEPQEGPRVGLGPLEDGAVGEADQAEQQPGVERAGRDEIPEAGVGRGGCRIVVAPAPSGENKLFPIP